LSLYHEAVGLGKKKSIGVFDLYGPKTAILYNNLD